MAEQYIESETFTFGGVEMHAMYYKQDGLYYFRITHVIKEPNGNLYRPGGGTSMDSDLEHLKYKLHHVYLSPSNFYEGCEMVYNEEF